MWTAQASWVSALALLLSASAPSLALLRAANGARALGALVERPWNFPKAWRSSHHDPWRAAVSMQAETKAKVKRPRLPRSRTASRVLLGRQVATAQFDLAAAETVSFDASGEAMPTLNGGSYPALVLNADFRPLSYLPLSLMSWQDSIRAVCRDSVQVLATYDRSIRSPSIEIPLPSVIVLKKYNSAYASKEPALTRRNLFMRDGFECQYCHGSFSMQHLTYDHLIPRKLGGQTTWVNTVTACGPCNNRKGSRLLKDIPNMHLNHQPRVPRWSELQQGSKLYPPKKMHESWLHFFN
ncbi:hypothetical protein T492DRAFT_1054520 [Pavlovales sp. CCMP2436]|nr:hypothetical protein T492DRAFT_1054520 [Pavlovales sp. CCMP2436]